MGLYDRDWYREEYQKKENAYGGDFSLNSKKVKEFRNNSGKNVSEHNYLIVNLLTILLCIGLPYPSFLVTAKITGGFPLCPIAVTIMGVAFFITAAKRRKNGYDKGGLNVCSHIISMISMLFSGLFSFWMIVMYIENNSVSIFNAPVPYRIVPQQYNWGAELFVIFIALVIGIPIYINQQKKRKIRNLIDNSIEMSPSEFLNLRKQRGIASSIECPGVYVLYNVTKKMYYVGQSKKVLNRIYQHFTGHGNGDVYADWKYGDIFTIRIIKLQGSGFNSLNALERDAIMTYKSFSRGYNKTRGNRG